MDGNPFLQGVEVGDRIVQGAVNDYYRRVGYRAQLEARQRAAEFEKARLDQEQARTNLAEKQAEARAPLYEAETEAMKARAKWYASGGSRKEDLLRPFRDEAKSAGHDYDRATAHLNALLQNKTSDQDEVTKARTAVTNLLLKKQKAEEKLKVASGIHDSLYRQMSTGTYTAPPSNIIVPGAPPDSGPSSFDELIK